MTPFEKIQRGELQHYLSKIISMPCWATVAGVGTGSMVLMSFGKKRLREIPIDNEHSSDDARHFDGELSLFIIDAEWQLLDSKDNNNLICDCYSSNEKNGEMDKGLSQLMNKKVNSTMSDFNGVDFEIDFEGGLKLCVIGLKDKESEHTNYHFQHG